MAAPFTIRVLSWQEAMPRARHIREKVFIEEQEVPRELEWDEWDEPGEHALALDTGGAALGTGRLLPDGRIGRMAVLKEWRRRGVGTAILAALLERARQRSMESVFLHAQIQATGFYRRFGFSERGGRFLEAGIPHVEMTLALLPSRA